MAKLALCLALVALLSCAAVAKVNVNLTDKLVDLIKKVRHAVRFH